MIETRVDARQVLAFFRLFQCRQKNGVVTQRDEELFREPFETWLGKYFFDFRFVFTDFFAANLDAVNRLRDSGQESGLNGLFLLFW